MAVTVVLVSNILYKTKVLFSHRRVRKHQKKRTSRRSFAINSFVSRIQDRRIDAMIPPDDLMFSMKREYNLVDSMGIGSDRSEYCGEVP